MNDREREDPIKNIIPELAPRQVVSKHRAVLGGCLTIDDSTFPNFCYFALRVEMEGPEKPPREIEASGTDSSAGPWTDWAGVRMKQTLE